MNAVIMDGAVVGEGAFVAAMSFVKAGFEVPARSLVAGIPARVLREINDSDLAWKAEATREYQELARHSLATMVETEALTEVEPNRRRLALSQVDPLYVAKGR